MATPTACPSQCDHTSEYECCLAAIARIRIPKNQVKTAEDMSYNLALTHAADEIRRVARL